MTDCTRKEVMIINAKLKEILLRHMDRPGVYPSAIRGVTLVRREAVNNSERCFEKPLASIIVQGSKHSTIGTQEYDIRRKSMPCERRGYAKRVVHHQFCVGKTVPFPFFLFGQRDTDRLDHGNGTGQQAALYGRAGRIRG